jgi:hypothetical protein
MSVLDLIDEDRARGNGGRCLYEAEGGMSTHERATRRGREVIG